MKGRNMKMERNEFDWKVNILKINSVASVR
jgi:hypothetical protein